MSVNEKTHIAQPEIVSKLAPNIHRNASLKNDNNALLYVSNEFETKKYEWQSTKLFSIVLLLPFSS